MLLGFFIFATLLVLASLAAIGFRNPVYAVFSLMAAFINAACLFLFLGAEFLAMVTVVVYVGAVVTLFLFVVMMLNVGKASTPHFDGLAFGLVACLFVVLVGLLGSWQPSIALGEDLSLRDLSAVLYGKYFVLFQLSGFIFIAAMVAPILLNLEKRQTKTQDPKAQMRPKKVKLVKGLK